MGASARAELIADRGAAAESPDFFRSRPFLEAEGATHTLLIESGDAAAALPVIVREIAGTGLRDATSPYGYPGASVSGPGSPPEPGGVDWGATGLVSVFVRERLAGARCLAGGRPRGAVQVHDPAKPRRLRPRLAEQVRRNERRGYAVELREGPAAGEREVAAFHALYAETMRRAGAAERYFFSAGYLRAVLAFERSWLLLARAPGGAVAAGAIAAISDGLLHYYLGGTAGARLADSPFKNVVAAMLGLADELGLPLNLGGGLEPGDGLERFKRGFANATLPFVTHEVVCDPVAYERLSAGRAASGGFFHAYRAPAA